VPASWLQLDYTPPLDRPPLVLAFSGWPDAGEVGSGAVGYLIRALGATRFASLDPEPFYSFSQTRPSTVVAEGTQRVLSWPTAEFFAARDPSGRDLVLFLGREPNLRWRDFVRTVVELAAQLHAGPVLTLGGTYDRVSHRGPATISGWSPTPELRHSLASMGVRFTSYEGPSSIQSAVLEGCARRELPSASLWGHAPHYVTGVANVKVAYTLLERLAELLGLAVELEPLSAAGQQLEVQIEQALAGRSDLQDYVRSLEARMPEDDDDPASAERIIEGVESFLRELDEDDDEGEEEPD
jgi:proteasome assembly chaperone (PAC2) family protein